MDLKEYDHIRSGGAGFIEIPRGLIAVWGKEAVQFLDGMITNDMKTLVDGQQMLAAFPNAQGRLLAVVRVLRQGDRFLIETEETTREKVFQNLFRFTFAGDFFVEDLSDKYRYLELFGLELSPSLTGGLLSPETEMYSSTGGLKFYSQTSTGFFVNKPAGDGFSKGLLDAGAVEIEDQLYETLRIESGVPKYGVDIDETTVVPETGSEEMISYSKGCYIGQEIIARIHFRGHVAKQLTGLQAESSASMDGFFSGAELTSPEGKNAGRITSVTYSPKLERLIALAYVRYDYLADGTELLTGEMPVRVTDLPFVD